MKIVIGSATYTAVKVLRFDPEADVTGMRLAVNEFTAEIMTTDSVDAGAFATLTDDDDYVWARYWIVEASHPSGQVLRLRAQSPLLLLDRVRLEPVMYSSADAQTAMAAVFDTVNQAYGTDVGYAIDGAFENDTFTGYCPEQTARERLQWMCFVLGAWVSTAFRGWAEVLPVSASAGYVPESDTFWRPESAWGDYVTGVEVMAYSYTAGEPGTRDKWVEADSTVYIQTEQSFALGNSAVPVTAAANVVRVEGVTLINPGNAGTILARMASMHYARRSLQADVVYYGRVRPGELCAVSTGEEWVQGYVKKISLAFGKGIRARMELGQVADVASAVLTVRRMYGEELLAEEEYSLPIGIPYEIENPYQESYEVGKRVFRPLTETLEGTLTGDTTATVYHELALNHLAGILSVYIVDQETLNGDRLRIR